MATNKLGCKRIILSILSFHLWTLVILIALSGFAFNVWIGFLFVSIVVFTHIIVAKREPSQEPTNTTQNPIEHSHQTTDDYYNQVFKAVENVYTDYKNVLNINNIETLIDSIGIQLTMNETPITEVKYKVRLLFWIDIVRCYTSLKHSIDLNSKEGLGLLYFIALTKGYPANKSYHDFTIVKSIYLSDAESITKNIKAFIDSSPALPEVFFISRLLLSNDTTLHRKFLVNIYRLASITAKADNTITKEEAEWLSNIMKLKGEENDDCVSQEDEKPKDTTEPSLNTNSTSQKSRQTRMLDKLIGLDSVKKEVEMLSNFIKIQQMRTSRGLKTSSVSYHCVFTGNPGTGKTTVARILAKIYKNLGVVSKGHLVETDRAGLVAEYVGQTAIKTNKIIDSALDGVLFIDEAYSLIGGATNDYGKEAIATLLKRMEDDRDRLIVILAGYTKNMKDFIDSNPGLQSRFNRYIEFSDYSAEELLKIFELNMKNYQYHFGEGAKETLLQYFTDEVTNKDVNFGNGRLVRNVFEKTLERQANRLACEVNLTTNKLSQIEIEDFPIKENLWKE